MGRTPSFTAHARGPDFYEWGKNGERDSASECDEVERDVGFLITKVMRALGCMISGGCMNYWAYLVMFNERHVAALRYRWGSFHSSESENTESD